jgi:serine/threonine-protein phosphatase PGAM5
MTRFLYLVRHGMADPHDGPLSAAGMHQAELTGRRLAGTPISAIQHGPLPRAAQTAGIISGCLPGVPVSACDLAGDYFPSDPDPGDLPPRYAAFVERFPAAERAQGARLSAAALERFLADGSDGSDARDPGSASASASGSDSASDESDTHEVVVTHNFLIGWLVSQALGAPAWRWLGLNQMNCALTVIACQPGLPPALLSFNDAGHLPPELRWTGFPGGLRPPTA